MKQFRINLKDHPDILIERENIVHALMYVIIDKGHQVESVLAVSEEKEESGDYEIPFG